MTGFLSKIILVGFQSNRTEKNGEDIIFSAFYCGHSIVTYGLVCGLFVCLFVCFIWGFFVCLFFGFGMGVLPVCMVCTICIVWVPGA